MTDETIIAACVSAIINARDFCGNENEACRDTLSDFGVKDKTRIGELMVAAFNEANTQWNVWRKRAGVKRVSRARDRRALEG